MIIPIEQLPVETLMTIIESYVLREGTDYGEQEQSFEQKVEQVKLQLLNGQAVLVYSELHESVDIQSADQYQVD